MRIKLLLAVGVAATLLAAGGACHLAYGEVPEGPPSFSDPLDIDNLYHPFVPFRIRLYEIFKGTEELTVIDVFLPDTRTFTLEDGTEVECATLQEWEIEEGEVVEISLNFFAQSDDGTVWYFGETVDIYEEGEIVSHDGSWLVGGPAAGDPEETLEADEPTIFMPADPEVGDEWKPEDLPEYDLEETVKVKPFVASLEVPVGEFEDLLRVREKTPDVEWKWYAPEVGFVQGKEQNQILALVALIDHDDEEEMEETLEEILDELEE